MTFWQVYGAVYLATSTVGLAVSGLERRPAPAGARVFAALVAYGAVAVPVGGRLLGWW